LGPMPVPGKINVLAELERLGKRYDFAGTENVKLLCPFHEDSNPSLSVSTEDGQFNCKSCGKKGDFPSLLAGFTDRPRAIVMIDLQQRYDVGDEPSVSMELVEQWHSRIWNAPPLLKALYDRGLNEEAVRYYRLGEHGGRITIPIQNAAGRVVNVKKYLPGAAGDEKMKNLKGRGKPRLFPHEQLKYDKIVVCGGEIKGIAAALHLNKHGIGGIGTTGGEMAWDRTFTEALAGKTVYICDDVDQTGIESAQMKARALFSMTPFVGVILLPLDVETYPHGDVNDFVGPEVKGDLFALVEACPKWEPSVKKGMDDTEPPVDLSLWDAYSAENTEKKIRVQCVIAAIAEDTYVVPAKVSVTCDQAQEFCALCRVFLEKKASYDIHPEDPANLAMLEATDHGVRDACMKAIGVPRQCPSFEHSVIEHRQADDIRVSPKLEMLNRDVERSMQRVICMRKGLQLQENYALIGRQYPHPKDQSATLLVSDYVATGDVLSNFKLEDPEALQRFKPKHWTTDSLQEKLDSIYADLERNVTFIRQRRPLHAIMDLVWHSSLFMMLDGRVEKAYAEALVVGDSSQGKSETAKRLLEHYGCGMRVECKSATPAGLIGGLQQLNGRWFVSWGIIPMHDKRMVILEELKGAPLELIAKMTNMRSDGIAEIPKIEKRRAMARTRLLALSNPRSERNMASYAFGIEAIKELIGAPEDIRRFDVCMILSKEEVSDEVINEHRSKWAEVEHVYDAESCKNLILWSWTRNESQVHFDHQAEEMVLKYASEMCKLFTSDVPIVDIASMRLKLARLSAAIAARTFSTQGDSDVENLLVRPCHVQWVRDFLTSTYSSSVFGYADFTKSVTTSSSMADPGVVKKALREVMHAREFCENLLNTARFDHQDIQDWSGTDRLEASALMSLLSRKRAVHRDERNHYVKTPGLIVLLKELLSNGQLMELPEHLKEGEF
jgi:hypothetical protein